MPIKQRYDRGDIRRMNAVSVLNQLRLNGPLSRANIAGELGLTRATVSSIVADLIEASLVNETEYVGGRAGRPGLLLDLNPNCGCMIAVEIDLDRISLVLANLGRETLWRVNVSVDMAAGPRVVMAQAAELVEQALQRGLDVGLKCFGICVALAGLVDHVSGVLAYGPTSGWEDVSLRADWEARFSVPVTVENEAHAGAIGVHHFGERSGVKNLIYLSIGVGLAAGVFVDGALLRGKQGFAGQVGHTLFTHDGIDCGCGKRGCWVTEIGASAIVRKLADAGVEVSAGSGDGVDWVELVAAKVQAGDPGVLAVLDGVGRQVGLGLARLVQTFNPSLVVVGGRLGGLMCLVDPAIREAMLAETLPYMADSLELVVHDSGEDQLQGCLATVFDGLMKNPALGVS
ncbi:MAG: putative NBD/HSP70 family sugar kinase [Lentimonas sp.]|jgi:predicted NBD/HSP70 family sugar kinase